MSGVQALLYDPTGVTLLAELDQARAITWQDELSKPGSATFEIPVDDPKTALVADRCIVKFRYRDAVLFGCVVTAETCTVAVDGGRTWLRYDTQPGVASILGRGVVLPEYGLTRRSGDDRLFGFMSKIHTGDETTWYVAGDWAAGSGTYAWKDDTSKRAGYPPVFGNVDKRAQWLAPSPGPNTVRPAGYVAYYRDTFTVASDMPVIIYVSADAFLTVYLDGETILEPDYTKALGWTTAQAIQTTLTAGTHILAARVENAITGGPVAFISTTVFLSDTGPAGEATETETLSGDVLFAFGSSTLDSDAIAAVDVIIDKMTSDTPKVTVVGHTDSVGSTSFNQTLSVARAQAVADRIEDQKPGAVLTVIGKGETEPVASDETSGGRAKNRRVTITYPHATEPTTTPGDTQTVTVVRRTDSRWKVHASTPVPGWFRASILRRLVLEGQQRDVDGFDALTIGYDDELDSEGVAWKTRGEYSFPNATLSVLEIAMQLAEAQMDWGVNPDEMILNAWVRRGFDRSIGADAVALWPGGNLKAYSTTRTAARVTTVLAHLSDGAWQETRDAAGVAAIGRVEIGLSLGSTLAPATAKGVADTVLSESAVPAVTITGETSSIIGPQPYVDYGLGDTVSVPGHRGKGRMKARVMSISVDATGDVVRAWPELVIDRSASIGIAGPDDSVWVVYATTGGQLTAGEAPAGAQLSVVTFAEDGTYWKLTVGDAEELVLTTQVTKGMYSEAFPWVLPTDDPSVLLAVWVRNGDLVAEETGA